MGVIFDANVTQGQLQQSETSMLSIPEDEMWQLIGACLWIHLSGFANDQLRKFLGKERIEDGSIIRDSKNEFPILGAELFATSTAYISSSLTRHLASFLRQKVSKGLPVTSLVWLDESSPCQSSSLHSSHQRMVPLEVTGNEERVSLLQKLLEISVCPDEICKNFVNERITCFPYNSRKFSGSWKDLEKGALAVENDFSPNNKAQGNFGINASVKEGGSILNNNFVTDSLMETKRSSSPHRDITSFHNPMEVLKRSGELLEVFYITEQHIVKSFEINLTTIHCVLFSIQ